MSTRTLVIVILLLVLFCGVPLGYTTYGLYPAGGLGLLVLILIILLILGKL